MNKLLKHIFCITALLWIFCHQDLLSQGQNDECHDCSGVPWSEATFNYSSAVCSGSVTYVTRICNGVYQLKILSFTGLNPSDGMIKIQGCLMYELLKNNPMQFPPATSQEGTINWKIIKSACWHYSDPEKHHQLPCSDNTCCYTKIKARKESNCGLIINIVDENGYILTDCETFGVGENGCFDTCIPTKLPNPIKAQ